ncbi:hypothetical protein Daus18300_004020 [Diaporthe australafricana]|uniref:2EXR domain-containing protein n=1 Tax=Diaporthe australafricana TaxID=127596 RepID=A0ABR3XB60_9PEZI
MAQFADLPYEIRIVIWEMVIREKRPGAHFFTVYNRRKDEDTVDYSSMGVLDSSLLPAKNSFPQRIGLAAPLCGSDGKVSWTRQNPSTYMEDSALWTLCWESRRHMLKRFRPAETSSQISRSKDRTLDNILWKDYVSHCDSATATSVLQRGNGELQYFTIQPSTDLIILQTFPSSYLSWECPQEGRFFSPLEELWLALFGHSLFSWGLDTSRRNKEIICCPLNVAIEFEPRWAQGEDYLAKFEAATTMLEIDTVWLIDYRLKLNAEVLKEETGKNRYGHDRKVFYARGRRFVEVEWKDYKSGEGDEAAVEVVGHEVFKFIRRLRNLRLVSARLGIFYMGQGWKMYDFKVLACGPI